MKPATGIVRCVDSHRFRLIGLGGIPLSLRSSPDNISLLKILSCTGTALFAVRIYFPTRTMQFLLTRPYLRLSKSRSRQRRIPRSSPTCRPSETEITATVDKGI